MENPLQKSKIPRWQRLRDPMRDVFLFLGRLFPFLNDAYIRVVHGKPDPWIYLVYSEGHNGTTSLESSLISQGFRPTFRLQMLKPERTDSIPYYPYGTLPMYYRTLIKRKKKLRIITTMRNPIDQSISRFFQHLRPHYKPDINFQQAYELFELFYRETPEDWFSTEMNPVLGIDIYSYPYQPKEGYLRVNGDWFELLVLRLENANDAREKQIASFLEADRFTWGRDINASRKHKYYPLYKHFKNQAVLKPELLDRLLSIRYAGHFYTEDELRKYRLHWSSPRV